MIQLYLWQRGSNRPLTKFSVEYLVKRKRSLVILKVKQFWKNDFKNGPIIREVKSSYILSELSSMCKWKIGMYERDSKYEAVLFAKAMKTKSVFTKRKLGRAKKSLNQEHKERTQTCKTPFFMLPRWERTVEQLIRL